MELKNKELEYAALGTMIVYNESLEDGLLDLTDDDFCFNDSKIIFKTMNDLFSKGIDISLVTLNNRLNETSLLESIGGVAKLSEISSKALSSTYMKSYVEQLTRLRHRRMIYDFGRSVVDAALDEKEIERLYQTVSDIPDFSQSEKEEKTAEIMQNAVDRCIERSQKKQIAGYSTGYVDIDKMTGGIDKGHLIYLKADPNAGKSLLAMCIGMKFAYRKEHVLNFNFEMTNKQIGDRLVTAGARVDAMAFKVPSQYMTNEIQRKIMNFDSSMLDQYYHIYSKMRNRTIQGIRVECRKAKMKYGKIDLITVDYLQRMHGKGEKIDIVERNSAGLKDLAQEFDCPVICIVSTNREGEIRGSGQTDFDADQKWLLKRKHDSEDRIERAKATLIIEKNRDGGKGKVPLLFREDYVCFENVAREYSR